MCCDMCNQNTAGVKHFSAVTTSWTCLEFWGSTSICLKLELILCRPCTTPHPCQLTHKVYARRSQVDTRSNATLQCCKAGSRLPQPFCLPPMPPANNLAVALTHRHGPEGTPPQKQRHGSLAATSIPPTPETAALGYRVEHLSATQDGKLVCTVCQQLQLPEVGSDGHDPNGFVALLHIVCQLDRADVYCCTPRTDWLHLQWFVQDLICFGAVYWCPVPPALSPARAAHIDAHHLSRLSWQRETAISKFGRQVLQPLISLSVHSAAELQARQTCVVVGSSPPL